MRFIRKLSIFSYFNTKPPTNCKLGTLQRLYQSKFRKVTIVNILYNFTSRTGEMSCYSLLAGVSKIITTLSTHYPCLLINCYSASLGVPWPRTHSPITTCTSIAGKCFPRALWLGELFDTSGEVTTTATKALEIVRLYSTAMISLEWYLWIVLW